MLLGCPCTFDFDLFWSLYFQNVLFFVLVIRKMTILILEKLNKNEKEWTKIVTFLKLLYKD